MNHRLDELNDLGARVLVVSFAERRRVADHMAQLGLALPTASDPNRTAYASFGMSRGSTARIFHPKTILEYGSLMLRGRKYKNPAKGDDIHQLGGDFVIDPDGVVVFAHSSERPDDRPGVQIIIDAIE